jgi:hypothetical protein
MPVGGHALRERTRRVIYPLFGLRRVAVTISWKSVVLASPTRSSVGVGYGVGRSSPFCGRGCDGHTNVVQYLPAIEVDLAALARHLAQRGRGW